MIILKQLHVKNFKCFKDSELTFSKLNIFTGANSSGKSAMLDTILAVAQSSEHFPFQLSPNGNYITMGDYYEFVKDHKLDYPIEIRVSLEAGKDKTVIQTTWTNDEATNMPTLKFLEAEAEFIQLSISKNRDYKVNIRFDEEAYKKSDTYQAMKLATDFFSQITGGEFPLKKKLQNIKPTISNGIINFQVPDCNDISTILLGSQLYNVDVALTPIQKGAKRFEHTFNYISSFRKMPERTYIQKAVSEPVSRSGDNTINQIFHWKTITSPKFKQLIKELRDMQLLSELTIKKYRGGRYEVRIKTRASATWASLADVGFGISQFLPIVVADLQLPKGSTLMVDQPELHLHPSAQAQLGDYFVRQTNSNNKCYFIETHSEYILNRIRALIAKGLISSSDISVYYFDNHGDYVDIHQIQFTKDGRVLNAPKSFFDTYMIDVMDIAISAAQNKKND